MNIFVVEDERWALAELAEVMKSYEPDHRIYAFETGDDALSAADNIHPHLVITDINMPGIDGLELIEHLHRMDPTIKSMILSVHDQFEYARQGMKFGVFDYLLKPVKKDALYKAVDKAIGHITSDNKRSEEWLNGSIAQMLLTADTPDYDVLHSVNRGAYFMILLHLDTESSTVNGWKDTWIHVRDVKKRFAAAYCAEEDVVCVDLDSRTRVLLIPVVDAARTDSVKQNAAALFKQLQLLPVPAHVGYEVKQETAALYACFSKLKQRMDEHISFGMPTFLEPGVKRPDADLSGLWDKVRLMEAQYQKGDMLKAQAVLRQLLAELERKQISKRQLKLFIHDMLYSLKYSLYAAKNGMVILNDLQEDVAILNRISGYEQLFEWLHDIIVHLYCGAEPKDLNPKGLIPVLLQLIHSNYRENISLQQFAADHHVSLGYLSRMFKSQTGTTFSEYVTGYRIRKAKELLSGGVERLQEISLLVGYEDSKHFSLLFKKIVGESPIAYARRNAAKQTLTNRKNHPL